MGAVLRRDVDHAVRAGFAWVAPAKPPLADSVENDRRSPTGPSRPGDVCLTGCCPRRWLGRASCEWAEIGGACCAARRDDAVDEIVRDGDDGASRWDAGRGMAPAVDGQQ